MLQDKAAVLLPSTGLQELLLMLLALRMDPVGQLLVIEIQVLPAAPCMPRMTLSADSQQTNCWPGLTLQVLGEMNQHQHTLITDQRLCM